MYVCVYKAASLSVVVVEVNCQLYTFIFPFFICTFFVMCQTHTYMWKRKQFWMFHQINIEIHTHMWSSYLHDDVLKKLFQFLSFYFYLFWHVAWVVIVIVGFVRHLKKNEFLYVRVYVSIYSKDNEKADKGRKLRELQV